MKPRGRLQREVEDIALLGLAAVMVPATWRLLMGWSWPDCIPGHDGIATVFLAIRELVEAKGRWAALAYRADLLGGMKVRDAVGPMPVLSLLARLPLSPTAVFNLFTFLIQTGIAFLGVRAATDLATVWSGRRPRLTWVESLAGVWLCGFMPALGWRLGYGHHTLVVGGVPFLAAAALLAASGAGTVTAALVLVAAAVVANGISFAGHQMVLNGVVFGGPILLGIWRTCGGGAPALGVAALTCAGAFLIAVPGFWGLLAHATGSDSLRSLGRMHLTYSWLTAQPLDWLTSIPWTRLSVPPWRPVLFHHEINYAAGPLLALLALVPWRRARPLAVGLGTSVVLVLLFSMNARPFSDALLLLVPPLNTFRVPTRAMLPALTMVPVLVLASVLARREGKTDTRGAMLLAVAGAAILFLLPSLAREVVGWGVAFGVVVLLARGRDLPAFAWSAALLAMAGGGLGAFRERLLPFVPGEAALARAQRIGEEAVRIEPRLASPLVRASLDHEAPEFGANTAFAARLSALDGYYFPNRRFVELAYAIRGEPYQPNALIVRFPEDHPTSRPMFQLYDVAWRVRTAAAGVELAPLPTPAGPAWFSAGFARVGSFAALGQDLVALGDGLGPRARETVWLVTADPRVAAAGLPLTVASGCAAARVHDVQARRGAAGASARVEVPADCPLTFAMNYAETLRASVATADGRRQDARVFPAYGALAGVWVPRGATEVRIAAVVPAPPWPGAWVGLGLALLAAAAVVGWGPRVDPDGKTL